MLNTSVAPWPCYSDEEAEYIREMLLSNRVNYWTGQEGREFEKEFSAWTGARHSIALANGTVALDLALKAFEIGPGDEVVVTPRTFIASVSAVVNAGATPVFADVDFESGNISAETISQVLTDRTRCIVPVHLAGWPADLYGILDMTAGSDIKVIEDCAQAHGAEIDGRSVGTIGHIGAWSFCQDKIMTTGGEGGMVTTDDDELWSQMWSFKDHGKSWDAVYNREHAPGFRWVHESFGTNWRMLEFQAAIGRIQLRRMAEWTERRTYIAKRIAEVLTPFANAVRVPEPESAFKHAYYRQYAYVRVAGLKSGWDRDRIVATCTARNIPVLHGSCSEVYREKAFEGTLWRPAKPLSVARELGETSLMFLTHPNQTEEDVERVCAVLSDVMAQAAR